MRSRPACDGRVDLAQERVERLGGAATHEVDQRVHEFRPADVPTSIALELGIATAIVAKHLEHIYRKLAVPNRTAAAAFLDCR